MCHVQFETLGKHCQHPNRHPPPKIQTKATQTQKYQQIIQKLEKNPWHLIVRDLTIGLSLKNSSSMLFSWLKFWCESEITRCPWLYYRIQFSIVFGESLKTKSIVTFRTEPLPAAVVCTGARESSGRGIWFSFNSELGRKYKFISWRTYMGIGSIFKERVWERSTTNSLEE